MFQVRHTRPGLKVCVSSFGGHHLPGRQCGPYDDVHIGLHFSREPHGLVPGEAHRAGSVADIHTGIGDFRGPAVHGPRGARFVYLTWGTVTDATFTMFWWAGARR